MVVVGILALLGEVSIRLVLSVSGRHDVGEGAVLSYLDAVLEAVELWKECQSSPLKGRKWLKLCAMSPLKLYFLPPSTSWRSGNRPGRLNASKVSIVVVMELGGSRERRRSSASGTR